MIFRFTNVRVYSTKVTTVMKYLNVAEKNDAAKSISAFLSNGTARRSEGLSVFNKIYSFQHDFKGNRVDMIMTSVSGHLMTHEFVDTFKGWQTCNPISLFEAPVYKKCPENYVKIRKTLEREIRSCHGLIIWTDCDREGENIGYEIIEVCRAIKPSIKVFRAKFSEITAVAVRRALTNAGEPDLRQSQAVDVRSELDLRIGAAFTRFQTLRYQHMFRAQIEGLVSYGSCQIPTLGFVARRFNDVERFIPQPFWKLKLTHTLNDLTVEFNWGRHRLFDKNCCEAFLMVCQANPTAQVTNVTQKPKNKWRPQAMDTIELEKLGSRKLKLSAKKTMTIAEKLYTQGIISYPRTETNMFSSEINLRDLVQNHTNHPQWGEFAQRVLQWGPNPRNGNKSDQAHPPIHPTKLTTDLGGDEKRVYELITRHFLACVSKDAVGSETTVNVNLADEEFTATGLCIYERNYLDVYIYEKWNSKEIHNYQTGNTFEPTELSMTEGSTSPPSLLTEADLIALMDKHDIGTDATHAEHINTIKERGYIGEINGGYLVPGTLGMGLVEGYDSVELPLAYPELRAGLEKDLKLICTGEKDPNSVLAEQIRKYKEVYQIITERIEAMDAKLAERLNAVPETAPPPTADMPSIDPVFKCPKCKKHHMCLRMKKDNRGYYLNCLGKPECSHTIWLEDIIKEMRVDQRDCQRCGAGNKKFVIKFKTVTVFGMLNDNYIADDNSYVSCLLCDASLRSLLDINESDIRPTNNNARPPTQTNPAPVLNNRTTANVPNYGNRQPNPPNSNYRPPNPPNNTRPNTANNPRPNPTTNGRVGNTNGGGNPNSNQSFGNDVVCQHCHQPAKKLTVRKEGPNKGRPFYVCPKDPQCPGNFFKWGDEASNNNSFAGPSGNSGTRNAPQNDNNAGQRGQGTRAKRKCGICKEEGHTRAKCPRNGG